MEIPGETYLFNLSLLAISFSVVSALITLLRQTMGGKLSIFDVYLVEVYVGQGFVVSMAALLPSLIAHFELPFPVVLSIASLCAAVLLAAHDAKQLWKRRVVASGIMPRATAFSFAFDGFAILLLVMNGFVPAIRTFAMFELALTVSLAAIMWIFLRRIATLIGHAKTEDWSPTRG